MSAKTRAFIFNFFCFGAFFILIRLGILYFFPKLAHLVTFFISGSIAILLTPRFAAFEQDGKEVVLMKWIFLKNIRKI